MRLLNITIINHKSLKNVCLSMAEDSYATLIGLNDAGKTTILKTVELFFSENKNLPEMTETSKISSVSNTPLDMESFNQVFTESLLIAPDYSDRAVYILAEFKIERIFTVEELDNLNPSDHLQHVLNGKNIGDSIYIMKSLSPNGEYFIYCADSMGDDNEPRQLWNQKQSDLKALQSTLGIEDGSIPNQNRRGGLKNIERILAIYNSMPVKQMWSRYDFKKDRDFYPRFGYLNWDINIDQLQSLVTTAIGPSIDESLKNIQAEVNKQQETINTLANERLAAMFEKYSNHLPQSITGLSANINIPLAKNTTEVFVSKNTSDKQIHIADQGDGIKRQIGLGLIRAIAEEGIGEEDEETKYVWVFDEPETHLYPQAQRELAETLRELSSKKFQIIVSTHSITFVDKTKLKDVYRTELNDCYTQILSTSDTEGALNTLGVKNSDFLFYNKFLAVEGATEYHLLDHFHEILYGKTLAEAGVRTISLGGEKNRRHYRRVLEGVLGDYRKSDDPIIFLLDKDTGVSTDGTYLVGDVADFEDSLANSVWTELLKNECGVDITNLELRVMHDKIDPTVSSTKIYSQLAAYVAADPNKTNFLSSKGEALANDIKKYITHESQIPQPFKDAFKTLV